MLIVNPDHYAVALRYDEDRMEAPQVSVKGRNHFALLLKDEAYRHGIAIIANPPLARALHRDCGIGTEISGAHYEAVAELYIQLYREQDAS
jgi:flagellar biosynthetic protein FlhB